MLGGVDQDFNGQHEKLVWGLCIWNMVGMDGGGEKVGFTVGPLGLRVRRGSEQGRGLCGRSGVVIEGECGVFGEFAGEQVGKGAGEGHDARCGGGSRAQSLLQS